MKSQIAFTAAAISFVLVSGSINAAEPRAHWSAAIGNGYTSETTTARVATDGAPTSPHWTAAIGTGRTAKSSSFEPELSAQREQSAARAHWSSKIGTGHASEASDRPVKKAPAVFAEVSSSTSSASGK
jgi:hypothetical protein